jgi:exodeoxyribonuclease VII small subunit
MTPTKLTDKPKLAKVAELSYEQALTELEAIVASLESNQLPLEKTMAQYERGQELIRHCIELLDKAELRVKLLSGETLVDKTPAEER